MINSGRLSFAPVLAGIAAMAPAVAVLAHKGLAILFAVAALAALSALPRNRVGEWRLSKPAVMALAGLLAWGALSAAWATDAAASLRQAAVLAAVFAGGLALIRGALALAGPERRQVGLALTGGFVVGLALLIEEELSGNFIMLQYNRDAADYSLNNGAVTLAILLWPTLLVVDREFGRRAAVALAVITLAALIPTSSIAAASAPLVGIGAIVLIRLWPRLLPRVLMAALAAAMLGAPFVPRLLPEPERFIADHPTVGYTLGARFFIWRNVAGQIVEKPLTGWGLNSSRSFSNETQKVRLGVTRTEPIPLHPHNAILQLWLETGAVGAAFAAAFLMALLAALVRLPSYVARDAGLATLATTLFVATVSFSVWQGWWMSAYWLTGTLFLAVGADPHKKI